jgi:hypothetical protein
MKLVKNLNTKMLIGCLIIAAILCFFSNSVNSTRLSKTSNEAFLEKSSESTHLSNVMETEKHKKHKKGKGKAKVQREKKSVEKAVQPPAIPFPAPAVANQTWGNITYLRLNNTFVKQNMAEFRAMHRVWDWKVMDKQLDDIYQDMNYQREIDHSEKGVRSFLQIFVNQFQNCDTNYDNILSMVEFSNCMKNDSYLATIVPPTANFASYINYTFTNNTGFYPIIFNILDTHKQGYLNFHAYMTLRLMAFSWRKCSVSAPFIEEVNFECALEVSSGYRTLPRTTVRRIFNLGIELSNSESTRNLDFITYLLVATSTRVYGQINGKEDTDITRSEFNMALDSNILPMRYNQDIINNIYTLIEDSDKPNQGIDVLSFVFYDFFLRIFDTPVPGIPKKRAYYLNPQDFLNTVNHYLFPFKTNSELMKIPQMNLTVNSYQMYTYLNISNFHNEQDHFLRSFVETDEKIMYVNKNRFGGAKHKDYTNFRFLSKSNNKMLKANTDSQVKDNILNIIGGNSNLAYYAGNTTSTLFNMLDNDLDGFINFYDYGNFIQIAYLFTKFDVYQKGRIVAGDLFEKFSQYADYPVVSYHLRERAKRFNLIPQDLYMDLSMTLLTLRIDDIIATVTRRVDKTTVFEYELKNVFAFINFRYVPDAFLNKCLRGTDGNNVPLYDWECAFVQGMIQTLKYYETSYAYLTTVNRNLTLANTVFYNTDSSLTSRPSSEPTA